MRLQPVYALLLAAAAGSAFAQRPARVSPSELRDAFLSIPEASIRLSRQDRQRMLERDATLDVEHGCIKHDASDNPENFEFAVFSAPGASLTAGLSWGPADCIVGAPDTCESDLQFFVRANNSWVAVGTSLLPKPFNKQFVYSLCQRQNWIEVKTQQGAGVDRLEFAGNGAFRTAR